MCAELRVVLRDRPSSLFRSFGPELGAFGQGREMAGESPGGPSLLSQWLQLGEACVGQLRLSLWVWVWCGRRRDVRALSALARKWSFLARMSCRLCTRVSLDFDRRLCSWPGNLSMAELLELNGRCRNCVSRALVLEAGEPRRSRAFEVMLGHPRTCVCPGCRAGVQHGFLWL